MGPCRAFNARSWARGTRLAYFGVGPIRVHGIISASIAVRCAWIALPSVDGLCPMTLHCLQSAAKIGRPRVDRRLLRLSWVRTAVLYQIILRRYAGRGGSSSAMLQSIRRARDVIRSLCSSIVGRTTWIRTAPGWSWDAAEDGGELLQIIIDSRGVSGGVSISRLFPSKV